MHIVNSGQFAIHFPIENRWVQKDDILLSPAYGRNSAYIACHVYHKKNSTSYFSALEKIFKAHGGRPHWGKMNSFTQQEVIDAYPQFSKFDEIRKNQDPDGMFTNAYLKRIIG